MEAIKKLSVLVKKTTDSQTFTKGMLNFGNQILYRNGVSVFKSGDKRRHWFFNPFLCVSVLLIFLYRDFTSLVVDNEKYSIIVGDFAFKFKLKKELNLILIVCS